MEKNNFLLDPLWNLETANASLQESIDYLYCIDEEYFVHKEKEWGAYLYWQFGAIIRTLRKALEADSMRMQESIDAIYAEKRKKEV